VVQSLHLPVLVVLATCNDGRADSSTAAEAASTERHRRSLLRLSTFVACHYEGRSPKNLPRRSGALPSQGQRRRDSSPAGKNDRHGAQDVRLRPPAGRYGEPVEKGPSALPLSVEWPDTSGFRLADEHSTKRLSTGSGARPLRSPAQLSYPGPARKRDRSHRAVQRASRSRAARWLRVFASEWRGGS
jgi:hypothetical protein